ncbi:hypothetical protein CTheo_7192 [Ceratobasidium theobromae]|uniref:Ricin B lectin domain-containing protein n=1 Tax=Ceratobasidium theobromae TaxID=1582974 RepID=A0A5N5QCN3_9AGAM|nr:hypothetical protein CTheo_7192 [Ceratobasidium theobromae]
MDYFRPGDPHLIQLSGSDSTWAGVGPIPRIFPPPTAPIRAVGDSFKSKFAIERLSEGKFHLKELDLNYHVGKIDEYQGKRDVVKLLDKDAPPQSWVIIPEGGLFRIQLPGPENLCWTVPITIGPEPDPLIVLEPYQEGSPRQQWKILPLLRE